MREAVRVGCELPPAAVARILWLRRRLLLWFARSGRSFHWREPGTTPYQVIVAEILLQRTTAVAVARVYSGFVERFPSWAALARAALDDLEDALRPLGLWRRKALAFQRFAQAIEANGGVVPCTRKELECLPGIGPYTAGAVLAIVYGRAEPLLDANMTRLLERFLGLPGQGGVASRQSLKALARRLVSGKRSLAVNWAVLDFGALVCRPRRPLCQRCPLRPGCQYAGALELHPTPSAGAPSDSRSAGGR